MSHIRQPVVAGTFYPSARRPLQAMIRRFLEEATTKGAQPKAIIAPHAGYIYSGPIAASAYARLMTGRGHIARIVLLGPSHRVAFRGLAVSSAEWFATPLGDIAIDGKSVKKILELPFVHTSDRAHASEHGIEVHLPFLQEILGNFSLVPVVVGDADPEEVAEVLELLWGGDETAVVISSDLSHYHDYATARRMDRVTSAAIEALRPQDISAEAACGRLPVSGLLYAAQRRGLKARTIDLRNSGDTAGGKDRVVGYGAYVFE